MQRPLQESLFISLSCHSNAQLLADSLRALNIQSWSRFHYHYRSQPALPTHVDKKVWKVGSTSSKTYFWGQYHEFFHSFQNVLHAAYKQLNNHHLPAADSYTGESLFNIFANETNLTANSLPLGWLFLPSPRLWLLSRPPRCQIPWPFWVLWQPAALFSVCIQHSQLADFCMFLSALTRQGLASSAGLSMEEKNKHQHKLLIWAQWKVHLYSVTWCNLYNFVRLPMLYSSSSWKSADVKDLSLKKMFSIWVSGDNSRWSASLHCKVAWLPQEIAQNGRAVPLISDSSVVGRFFQGLKHSVMKLVPLPLPVTTRFTYPCKQKSLEGRIDNQ